MRKNLECGLISIYMGRYESAVSYLEKAIEKNVRLKSTIVYKGLEKISEKNCRFLMIRS